MNPFIDSAEAIRLFGDAGVATRENCPGGFTERARREGWAHGFSGPSSMMRACWPDDHVACTAARENWRALLGLKIAVHAERLRAVIAARGVWECREPAPEGSGRAHPCAESIANATEEHAREFGLPWPPVCRYGHPMRRLTEAELAEDRRQMRRGR